MVMASAYEKGSAILQKSDSLHAVHGAASYKKMQYTVHASFYHGESHGTSHSKNKTASQVTRGRSL